MANQGVAMKYGLDDMLDSPDFGDYAWYYLGDVIWDDPEWVEEILEQLEWFELDEGAEYILNKKLGLI